MPFAGRAAPMRVLRPGVYLFRIMAPTNLAAHKFIISERKSIDDHVYTITEIYGRLMFSVLDIYGAAQN